MSAREIILRRAGEAGPNLLFIEPYLSSSHEALVNGLFKNIPARWTLIGLPGRFFRWRMRGAAAYLAEQAAGELSGPLDGVLCSEMLNLAELRGLVPALARVPVLVYFHENQLAYPTPGRADARQQDRDLYLAFANLTSALAAKKAVFNSKYHLEQFLGAARDMLDRLPDARPLDMVGKIAAKARVLPVPLDVREAEGIERPAKSGPLRLVWNHRWEHDKDPEAFFRTLFDLAGQGADFQVAVLGRRSARWPEVFDQASEILGGRLVHMGPVESRREYWQWLFWADVAVSTALQEYLGLAVAEAVWAGCRPLVPDGLAYPEFYPKEFRYPPGRLGPALAALVENPGAARAGDYRALVDKLTWPNQAEDWRRFIWEKLLKK